MALILNVVTTDAGAKSSPPKDHIPDFLNPYGRKSNISVFTIPFSQSTSAWFWEEQTAEMARFKPEMKRVQRIVLNGSLALWVLFLISLKAKVNLQVVGKHYVSVILRTCLCVPCL
jgi:hypothetical protein